MVHRLLTLFAIAVVALFSVASDLSSLATYFGLLTAGMTVALQNVILASLGYLVLMGAWNQNWRSNTGVRHYWGCHQYGHAAISVERIRCTERAVYRSCGNFFKSLVFLSPATGLLRLSSAPEKAVAAVANDNGTEPDAELHESAGADQR